MRKIDSTLVTPQMKCRKMGKALELRASFDESLLSRLASSPMLAPLVEDCIPGEPDFDRLRDMPEMKEFIRKSNREPSFTIFVRSEKGENVEKAVCLVDDNNRTCAISAWKRGQGISFEIVQ